MWYGVERCPHNFSLKTFSIHNVSDSRLKNTEASSKYTLLSVWLESSIHLVVKIIYNLLRPFHGIRERIQWDNIENLFYSIHTQMFCCVYAGYYTSLSQSAYITRKILVKQFNRFNPVNSNSV